MCPRLQSSLRRGDALQDHAPSRFTAAVRDQAGSLTPSECRLVAQVLSEPRSAALATVTDLARGAGVHEATVSRLARKLGYEGFGAFRQALRDESIPSQEAATRLQRTIEGSGDGGVLGTLVAHEVAGLSGLLAHVTDAQVADVATRLMAVRRVHLFGTGNAEVVALMMAKRHRRFGRDVHLLAGSARDMAKQVLGMDREDAVLLYAFRRQPRHYAPLVGRAREVGAATIAISGTAGHLLSPRPDLRLCAPRSGDAQAFQTLTVPMAISNAVVIAAGALADTSAIETLDGLGALIERFE